MESTSAEEELRQRRTEQEAQPEPIHDAPEAAHSESTMQDTEAEATGAAVPGAATGAAETAEAKPAAAATITEPPLQRRATSRDPVSQYMTPRPKCLNRNMTLLQAVRILLAHDISGAPVVEPFEGDTEGCGRLVGVLSEEDILWKEVETSDVGITETFREPYLWSLMAFDNVMMETVENQALKVLSNMVGLSMSEVCISVGPGTPMSEAASIMLDAKVKRLPVVQPRPDGRPGMTVVGIVSRKDMLRHVLALLEERE